MSNRNNKIERLLAATDVLFLQRGLDSVTLSDIAHMANVPLGNIYYYFKSKDLILKAVLKIRFSYFKIDLIKLEEANKTAKNQLRAFNEEPPTLGHFVTVMLMELEKKQNKHLYNDFSPIIDLLVGWCEKKFIELDPKGDAKNNTSIFITALIGACTFLLNKNVDFSSDAYIKGYISFILKQFGLEDQELDSNIATFPDNKSAWRK